MNDGKCACITNVRKSCYSIQSTGLEIILEVGGGSIDSYKLCGWNQHKFEGSGPKGCKTHRLTFPEKCCEIISKRVNREEYFILYPHHGPNQKPHLHVKSIM